MIDQNNESNSINSPTETSDQKYIRVKSMKHLKEETTKQVMIPKISLNNFFERLASVKSIPKNKPNLNDETKPISSKPEINTENEKLNQKTPSHTDNIKNIRDTALLDAHFNIEEILNDKNNMLLTDAMVILDQSSCLSKNDSFCDDSGSVNKNYFMDSANLFEVKQRKSSDEYYHLSAKVRKDSLNKNNNSKNNKSESFGSPSKYSINNKSNALYTPQNKTATSSPGIKKIINKSPNDTIKLKALSKTPAVKSKRADSIRSTIPKLRENSTTGNSFYSKRSSSSFNNPEEKKPFARKPIIKANTQNINSSTAANKRRSVSTINDKTKNTSNQCLGEIEEYDYSKILIELKAIFGENLELFDENCMLSLLILFLVLFSNLDDISNKGLIKGLIMLSHSQEKKIKGNNDYISALNAKHKNEIRVKDKNIKELNEELNKLKASLKGCKDY